MIGAAALAAVAARPVVAPTPVGIVAPTPVVDETDLATLRSRGLLFPVPSVRWQDVTDTYADRRGGDMHQALDIPAARDAAVVAVDDSVVAKLFPSAAGGLTLYLFDRESRFAYYYAHLNTYADGLHETQLVARGDVVGSVGTTGNAAPDAPHLHFAIFKLEPIPRWWRGTTIDPYPLLKPVDAVSARPATPRSAGR